MSGGDWGTDEDMTNDRLSPEVHRTADHPDETKDSEITPTTQDNGELTEDEIIDADRE